jgi:energy-coupling factor transport system permease protein
MTSLRYITLGRYLAIDSILHRLDPRTKMVGVLGLMVLAFLRQSLLCLVFLGIIIVVMAGLGRIPYLMLFKNIRPFAWLILLTLLFHGFFTPGNAVAVIPVTGWKITIEGLQTGVIYTLRLIYMIMLSAVMMYTTSPLEMTDGLESLMSPLKKLRVPTSELALMISIALRFLPTLVEEADRVWKVQVSRGLDLEGSLIKKIKGLVPLILPLIFSSLRKAEELAVAMEARGYRGGEGRTYYTQLRYGLEDGFALIVFGMTVSIFLLLPGNLSFNF